MSRLLFSLLVLFGVLVGFLWAGNAGWGPVVVTPEYEFKVPMLFQAPWRGVIDEPGMTGRIPLAESVLTFEKRFQYLNVEPAEMIIAGGERQIIDYYTIWRIDNPVQYLERFRGNREAAEAIIRAKLKGLVGAVVAELSFSQLLQRVEIGSKLDDEITRELEGTGVAVVDVRISRTELPSRALPSAFGQMREERRSLSREYRALGDRDARQIRAEAEREARKTLAQARADAERLRGEGDAAAAATYASAFGKDPEFYAFRRSLEAYRRTLGGNTTLVVAPTHEFFRYLEPQRRLADSKKKAAGSPTATAPPVEARSD